MILKTYYLFILSEVLITSNFISTKFDKKQNGKLILYFHLYFILSYGKVFEKICSF